MFIVDEHTNVQFIEIRPTISNESTKMLFAISDTLVNASSDPIGGSFNLTLNQINVNFSSN